MRKEKAKPTVAFEKLVEHYNKALNEANTNTDNLEYYNECERLLNAEKSRLKGVEGHVKVSSLEVRDICKNLKNNKAKGPLGASNELFKYAATEELFEMVAQIIEVVTNYHTMPQNMNT